MKGVLKMKEFSNIIYNLTFGQALEALKIGAV